MTTIATQSSVAAPTAKDLIGAWHIESATVERDGQKVPFYGENPKGILIFTSGGQYALEVMRSDLPKFASGNKDTGTADENRAVVQGSIANYGRYLVENDNLVLEIEFATFPNWNGVRQTRPFKIEGDELHYKVIGSSTGGTAEFVWRRVQ